MRMEVVLNVIKTVTSPADIKIFSDSRSTIQPLWNWTKVYDKSAISILNTLKELSQQRVIYFQRFPSHIELYNNEMVNLLAKEDTIEVPVSGNILTFSERSASK
ncbi:hypothetical protein TNIN_437051 [Trichonephila inaurata madagascariensis]|uniref:RNase H type-1 domain-containing protein n=1 Tax=Trichonephila inaurata madagascariensis TaxID=2747483 RepID=A0A8X7CHL4_9ARAC|nr:hypothetical protein TNIN_437051 [Trichonephila inaurata madagascariensis]